MFVLPQISKLPYIKLLPIVVKLPLIEVSLETVKLSVTRLLRLLSLITVKLSTVLEPETSKLLVTIKLLLVVILSDTSNKPLTVVFPLIVVFLRVVFPLVFKFPAIILLLHKSFVTIF